MQLDIYISAQKMPPLMALISFSPLRNATKARNTPWQPTRTCSPLSLRTPLQPMLAGTPALFESAMISPAKSTWRSSVSIFQKSNVPILFVLNRDLVRAGAMGAWAPVKIEQRVPGTRPQKRICWGPRGCRTSSPRARVRFPAAAVLGFGLA